MTSIHNRTGSQNSNIPPNISSKDSSDTASKKRKKEEVARMKAIIQKITSKVADTKKSIDNYQKDQLTHVIYPWLPKLPPLDRLKQSLASNKTNLERAIANLALINPIRNVTFSSDTTHPIPSRKTIQENQLASRIWSTQKQLDNYKEESVKEVLKYLRDTRKLGKATLEKDVLNARRTLWQPESFFTGTPSGDKNTQDNARSPNTKSL